MAMRGILAVVVTAFWLGGGAWAQSQLRPDLAAKWKDASGQLVWPKNDGCAGAAETEVLPEGLRLDRYGSDYGTFFALPGTPYPERAMPYQTAGLVYHVYVVVKPLSVSACKIAPWFDEPGGGEQFKATDNVTTLKAKGVLAVAPEE